MDRYNQRACWNCACFIPSNVCPDAGICLDAAGVGNGLKGTARWPSHMRNLWAGEKGVVARPRHMRPMRPAFENEGAESYADAIRRTCDVCPAWEWDGWTGNIVEDDWAWCAPLGCYVVEELVELGRLGSTSPWHSPGFVCASTSLGRSWFES